MLKHIVFWTLKESADGRSAQENAREIKARLESLRGRIPGLVRLEVGIDISRSEASADVVLYSELESREALDAYQTHPEHVPISVFVSRVREQRMVVDYVA